MTDYSLRTDPPLRWSLRDYPATTLQGDKECLSNAQKYSNALNLDAIRNQNARYLAKHPEIRAITSMIVQKIMSDRPKIPLSEYCCQLFKRHRSEILKDLKPYLVEDLPEAEDTETVSSISFDDMLESMKVDSETVTVDSPLSRIQTGYRASFGVKITQTDSFLSLLDRSISQESVESIQFTQSIEDILQSDNLIRTQSRESRKRRRKPIPKKHILDRSEGRLSSILTHHQGGNYSYDESYLKIDDSSSIEYKSTASIAPEPRASIYIPKKRISIEHRKRSLDTETEKYLIQTRYLAS